MIENFKEFIKNNKLKLIKEVDGIDIIIPEEIYIHENKTLYIDMYTEMYILGMDLKNKFNDYILGNLIDEQELINQLKRFNDYEFNDLVSHDLKFYPDKLRERMIKSEEWLDLDTNKIITLKEEAQKLVMMSDKHIKLTNEKLDEIIENLKNARFINFYKENDKDFYRNYIESEEDSYLVIGFEKINPDSYNYRRVELVDGDDSYCIDSIYANKEPLSYIVAEKLEKYWYVKYVKLDNNLSREDYNLIVAHAYAKFMPTLDINSKLEKNRKWATISQLRQRFDIGNDISTEKLKIAFKKVKGLIEFNTSKNTYKYSCLYDIELFQLACNRYDETEKEPLGYIFKDNN